MRHAVVGLALVLVGGVTTAARAQDGDDGSRYRLATAVVGDVQQTLTLSGTVEHTNRSDVSFGGSGTLAEMYVAEGDRVKAGQKLAALATDELEAAVIAAEAQLAQAKAQLEADQEAQDEAEETSPPKGPGAEQRAVMRAMGKARKAMAAQQRACQPMREACARALAKVQRAQQAVAMAQDRLQQALAQPVATEEQPTAPSDGAIAEDRAAIDQAEAELLSAERALAAAVLRAPRAGTVVALPVQAGDAVEAGSTVATVVGKGATTVSTSATVEQVKRLAVGQPATVTVPGVEPLSGTVSDIALLPSSGTDETTYPVTITLNGGGGLPTGSTAGAAVVVATADDVVTVPASAVKDGSVQVVGNGDPVEHKVTVGAVGATTIEVGGIDAGTRVVLADRQADLPSTQNQGPGGLGGFGGGPRQEFRAPAGGPVVVEIG